LVGGSAARDSFEDSLGDGFEKRIVAEVDVCSAHGLWRDQPVVWLAFGVALYYRAM
jgi:hypothetical protein